jgi:thiosulfate/3-mercaptopyruvate sulfurtransferase
LSSAASCPREDPPLKWPVPPPGPPREIHFPRILIGVEELRGALAAGAVPLDARNASSFERGHLPGAVSAWRPEEENPWGVDRVRSLLGERGITGESTVVIYGDPDHEAVARLFWLLQWAGCREVRILNGGLEAWLAAGRRLETGLPHRAAAEFRLPAHETVLVDSGWVASAFGQTGVELLDVRDARGWDRWQTPPTFAAGHIPHSLPFDPRSLLGSKKLWPDPAGLRRHLSKLGPRAGDPVNLDSIFVLYGDDARDPRLGLGYLLLTLAGLEAQIFPGGWREWTAGGGRPIVRVVSAPELAALLKREDPGLKRDLPSRGTILIDLRETRDFAIGHLPGAFNLLPRSFTAIFEEKVQEGWPDADRATIPLVFYCYGIDCIRSRTAASHAARLGFSSVLWFRGGVREWRDSGLPLVATTAPRARASPGVGAARR